MDFPTSHSHPQSGNDRSGDGDADIWQPDHHDLLSSSHPAMAAAVRQKRKGWQGEELELQHDREKMAQSQGTSTTRAAATTAAVDLNQFRNVEVGQGYQAKHVVRQRTVVSSSTAVTAPVGLTVKQDDKGGDEFIFSTAASSTPSKEQFLHNSGLREFRKEIEKILNS
jgi:hypothetical protein